MRDKITCGTVKFIICAVGITRTAGQPSIINCKVCRSDMSHTSCEALIVKPSLKIIITSRLCHNTVPRQTDRSDVISLESKLLELGQDDMYQMSTASMELDCQSVRVCMAATRVLHTQVTVSIAMERVNERDS